MTTTRDGRFQFSVRSLLLALAGCSLVFAVLPLLGVVAGSTAAMMLAVYMVIRRLSPRWQVRSLICFLMFAVPPHFGIPGYYFGSNVGQWKPPQLGYIGNVEILLPIVWAFEALYLVGEFPLQLLSLSRAWADYLGFKGDVFRIRPFVVWTFWRQMAAAAAMAMVASQIEGRRLRSRHSVEELANGLTGEQGLLNPIPSQAAAEPAGLAKR